ncbi:MAG: hypothetical protein JJ992_02570, partial [Planctomycetes bacterium]|nr:hypothetical protein [Planctomycetota bacterium]
LPLLIFWMTGGESLDPGERFTFHNTAWILLPAFYCAAFLLMLFDVVHAGWVWARRTFHRGLRDDRTAAAAAGPGLS